MAKVSGKDTKPELRLRRFLHGIGYRYRLHPKGLPGKPDMVFPKYRAAIFVHGCFWHRCPKCDLGLPKSNVDYWRQKFEKNVERDRKKEASLQDLGWRVHTIWECELASGASQLVEILNN